MFATNWAEINNLYRGTSIYASYQVSIHLAKRFQIYLEIDQPETITAYGYSVSGVKILVAMFVNGSGRNVYFYG